MRKMIAVITGTMVGLLLFVNGVTVQAQTPMRTMRVGYFSFDGFHMIDENGDYGGYGYQFLQKLSMYANVNIELVGYEKSWADMLPMLEAGELDFVMPAHMSPERLEKYAFTAEPIGTSYTLLTALETNSSFVKGDYTTYNGKRYGLMTGNASNQGFFEYADSKGFTYQEVYFDNFEVMKEALKAGQIDAMVSNSIREVSGEMVLDSFDNADFYGVVRPEDTELLKEIDKAIGMMNTYEGDWRSEIYNSNFSLSAAAQAVFTPEETAYLESVLADGKMFTAVAMPDRVPYSYYEGDVAKGINVDIFREVMKNVGIPYEIVVAKDREEYQRMIDEGSVDIIIDHQATGNALVDCHYVHNKTYLTTNLCRVNRIGAEVKRVGITSTNVDVLEHVMNVGEDVEIVYFDTLSECLRAVERGDVDSTLSLTYSAEKAMMSDSDAVLSFSVLSEHPVSFCMAVHKDIDRRLSTILVKGMNAITSTSVHSIIESYTLQTPATMSIVGIIRNYPWIVYVGIIVALILGGTIAAIFFERRNIVLLRRKNEELIQAKNETRAKTTFLFNMSHDLRTPMNAILGFATLAKKNLVDKVKVEECIDKIAVSGNYLLKLINDVLDMAQIENGKIIIDEVLINIEELMEELDIIFAQEAKNKGIVYESAVTVTDKEVYCDSLRMKQIAMNLISNAVKYTKPGGNVLCKLNQLPTKQEDRVVYELLVADTGIGMSKDFQRHIFDMFEREHNTTTSGIQGTGLGMAITKRLVDILGGEISLSSTLGKGTIISVKISLRKKEVEHTPEEMLPEKEYEFVGKRVLVVEDNELNREIAEAFLAELGLTVESAEDGAKAVALVKEKPICYYDLIMMDVQMPYMNGYDATRAIRQLSAPEKANIPIIAMTANAFEQDKKNALECGMNQHIAKPIDIQRLAECIAQYLGDA